MTITIGVDVSKSHLDIYDSKNKLHKRYENTEQGVKDLLDFYSLEDLSSCHIVMESTGIYQRILQDASVQVGMNVYVVNPCRVRQFARSSGRLAKTDRLDASILCLFGEKMDPRSVFPRTSNEHKLGDFLRLRQHLVSMCTSHKNHLETHNNDALKAVIEETIKAISKQIKELEKKIRELIAGDEVLLKKQKILLSAPGIGDISSWHFLAFCPELGKVSRNEIASLGGVAPHVCESGSMRGRAMIQGGRRWIRNTLYMSILSTIVKGRVFEKTYKDLRERGKPAKVSMVACMRRLLVRLNCMMRNEEVWRSI